MSSNFLKVAEFCIVPFLKKNQNHPTIFSVKLSLLSALLFKSGIIFRVVFFFKSQISDAPKLSTSRRLLC